MHYLLYLNCCRVSTPQPNKQNNSLNMHRFNARALYAEFFIDTCTQDNCCDVRLRGTVARNPTAATSTYSGLTLCQGG